MPLARRRWANTWSWTGAAVLDQLDGTATQKVTANHTKLSTTGAGNEFPRMAENVFIAVPAPLPTTTAVLDHVQAQEIVIF